MKIPLPDGAILESTTEDGVPVHFLEVTDQQARGLQAALMDALGKDEIVGSGDAVAVDLAAEYHSHPAD